MKNLSKSENKSVLKWLAELAIERASAKREMSDSAFQAISEDIAQLVKTFNPSGHNDKLEPFLKALKGYFSVRGLNQEFYWKEVWIRGGRKSMDAYNGVQGPTVT